MASTITHLAIADKIYSVLGDSIIKNLPLFFGGNIAPDAIHSKKDYQRADKEHSHLCNGIHLYGYGYPEIAHLFKDRVNEFIDKYYMNAGEDRDLYFGYIVHLLVDKIYTLSLLEQLEKHVKNSRANLDEPEFRKRLASEISSDPLKYNPVYVSFFDEASSIIDVSANNYDFKQNVVDILEAVWDYEVKDYIGINEININKRWVINTYFKREGTERNGNRETAKKFVELTAKNIIKSLHGIL